MSVARPALPPSRPSRPSVARPLTLPPVHFLFCLCFADGAAMLRRVRCTWQFLVMCSSRGLVWRLWLKGAGLGDWVQGCKAAAGVALGCAGLGGCGRGLCLLRCGLLFPGLCPCVRGVSASDVVCCILLVSALACAGSVPVKGCRACSTIASLYSLSPHFVM
jgi:hypothetical protein